MYLLEERETLIRYDEFDDCWYFDSNVRKHISKILKSESAFETVDKELEDGRVIAVSAKLSDLENFLVNPFVKSKPKLTKEQKRKRSEKMKELRRRQINSTLEK